MKFSVIIPTLNEAEQIAELITSTRKLGECEIIVVDGGSTDETVSKAVEADLVITSSPGRAHQQNLGAEKSSGEILIFLHADCSLEPGALEAIETALQDEKVIAGCFHQCIDSPGLAYRLLELGNGLRVRIFKWMYGDQGIFLRKKDFKKLGGFPPLKLMEDLYFSKELKKHRRIRIVSPPLHVSARRWKQNGIFRQTFRNWMLILKAHTGWTPDELKKFYPDER